jgi:cytochrome c peroxidase
MATRIRPFLCATALTCAALLPRSDLWAQRIEPIVPVPIDTPREIKKVTLGRDLFHDKRLSKGNAIACIHCHQVSSTGADGLAKSIGLDKVPLTRNSPTVFNVSLNFMQGWGGRSASLEHQTDVVMNDPTVMGSSWQEARVKLGSDNLMQSRFRAVYADGLQPKNIADALVAYQRSLTTPNSRFDKYLRGDASALSTDEVRGYALFKINGCVACHQGVNIGGNMLQVFGVIGERGAYFKDRGSVSQTDYGRYNHTNKEADRYVFKVPSLRNVALTAPYLHDGSAATLDDAVNVMFKYQLGRTGSREETELIVRFLRTLTGELDGKPLDGR